MGDVKLDLLSPGIEVGLVTTNLEPMVAFYEGFLELEPQGDIDFEGGTQRRYSLGANVLKLVTYTTPPPAPAAPPPLFLAKAPPRGTGMLTGRLSTRLLQERTWAS